MSVGRQAVVETPAPTIAAREDRQRAPMIALAAVIAVFVALGMVIAAKTPAFESADEPGHVQNIETLVSGHWYSMAPHCTGRTILTCFSGTEAHQAPLYYLVLAGWQRISGQPAEPAFNALVHFGGPGILGYHGETFTIHRAADHRYLLWLRLPNVLFGALTVLLTYFAVRLITIDIWTPVVAGALVAFLPRFVFLSSFVTNDNLVDLFGALLVLVALKYALAPGRWRMAAVGGSVGLLVVTKLSALPIALVILALAWMATGWRRRAELAAVGCGSALAICGWYLIQNTVRYGDPLARTASARYLSVVGGLGTAFGQPYRITDPLGLVFSQVPRRIVETFWYQSGWNQFRWSGWIDLLITATFGAAVLGLVHGRTGRRPLATLITISVLSLLCVWIVAFQTSTYQARYAFVGLAAICGLAALGLQRWKLAVRFALPLAGLIGTLVAIRLDVLAVHWT